MHVAHFSDGYPLCWPYSRIIETNDTYKATKNEDQVDCVDCIQILSIKD